MSSPESFARRQRRVEKGLLHVATQPQLGYSSIDDGALEVRDINGEITAIIGTQFDGTSTAASVGGTTPVAPTVPLVVPVPGGLALYWDGTYVDDSPTRMDFQRITFHAVTDVDDLDVLNPAQIVGEITIATGGEVFATLPPVEHFIFATTWTQAGKFSVESDVAFGTPLEIVDAALWQEHEDALELLNGTTLPTLQADLDAAEADIIVLTGTTIPALQADLDANEAAVTLLNDTTLPALQSDLDAAEADVAAVIAKTDGWTTTGETTIDGGEITADSVTAAQIAANAITTTELAASAVTAAKIAADTITANEIAADAITANEIAANAVTTTKLAANAVTAAKIAADTITANEIAADTITADEIAADTITANEIAADTITANEVAAGAITASELDVEVLRAGFTLTGRVQVGTSYWTPAEGLVIPQPGGGRIQLPADGVTPARFDGHVTARSATIDGNLNILGATNKVSGLVKLSNGIVEPTVAPAMFQTWQKVATTGGFSLDGSGTPWRLILGMSTMHGSSDNFVVAVQFGGTFLRAQSRTTGMYVPSVLDTDQGWQSNYNAWGGVTYTNGNYFTLGMDGDRGNDWYIYKIRATDGVKVAEFYVGPPTTYGYNPVIVANTALNQIHVLWSDAAGNGYNRVWNENLGNVSGPTVYNGYGIPVNHEAAWIGTGDFGSQRLLLSVAETNDILSFTFPGLIFQSTESFPRPENTPVRGIWYDSTAARFRSYDKYGSLFTLSSWKTSQALTASYTWYDAAGTVRETKEGPSASYTLPARSWLTVETSVPPDSGNTDAAQVDKANMTKVYVGVGAGSRRVQNSGNPLGVDGSGVSIRSLTMDTISTVSATTPATNTFIGGTTSTGKITSAAESGGNPLLEVSGDGTIKASTVTATTVTATTVNGQTLADTGWTALPFGSGFSNLGSGFENCEYRRRNGVVYVRGLATSAARTTGSIIGTLPAGFRPGGNSHVATASNGAFAIINVQTDGQIKFNAGATSGWLSIQMPPFVAEN